MNAAATTAPLVTAAVRVATATAGTAMVLLPATGAPWPAQAVTAAGLLLVAATVAGPLARRTATGTLAGASAVVLSVFASPGTAGAAAEGLLILGYLLLLDAPRGATLPTLGRWLRLQAPAVAWGAAAAAAVAVALAVTVPVSAWFAVAGVAAAVTATGIALPRLRGRAHDPAVTTDPGAGADPPAGAEPGAGAGPAPR